VAAIAITSPRSDAGPSAAAVSVVTRRTVPPAAPVATSASMPRATAGRPTTPAVWFAIMAVSLHEVEQQIAQLSRPEKAHLLRSLAIDLGDTWPGIERTAGVAGGDACVVRTRIAVWTLESYRRLGWTEARILENFRTLRAADLVNVWVYASAHVDEIERAIRENEEA
jgi:uncharacterized protein (DUF433 family)